VPELALDDRQRDAFACHLDSVGVTEPRARRRARPRGRVTSRSPAYPTHRPGHDVDLPAGDRSLGDHRRGQIATATHHLSHCGTHALTAWPLAEQASGLGRPLPLRSTQYWEQQRSPRSRSGDKPAVSPATRRRLVTFQLGSDVVGVVDACSRVPERTLLDRGISSGRRCEPPRARGGRRVGRRGSAGDRATPRGLGRVRRRGMRSAPRC
jgi:hypothetical protein